MVVQFVFFEVEMRVPQSNVFPFAPGAGFGFGMDRLVVKVLCTARAAQHLVSSFWNGLCPGRLPQVLTFIGGEPSGSERVARNGNGVRDLAPHGLCAMSASPGTKCVAFSLIPVNVKRRVGRRTGRVEGARCLPRDAVRAGSSCLPERVFDCLSQFVSRGVEGEVRGGSGWRCPSALRRHRGRVASSLTRSSGG